MAFYLAGLNAYILFVIIFASISIISIIALLLVHKFFYSILRLLEGNRFLVPFFTINGAVLGFLLAMVLVETWKNYQNEKENITNEMSNYLNIYRTARGLENKDCIQIQNYVKRIVRTIIKVSWLDLEKGGNGTEGTLLLNEFQLYILKMKPNNIEQNEIRTILIENLGKASELRRHRLLSASQDIVPKAMWVVIIFCIFISIFSGFIFEIKPISIHIALTIFQCAMISFVLFLMIGFMYPYRGPMKIEPIPFERLLINIIPRIIFY